MISIMPAKSGHSAFGGKKYWPIVIILIIGTALRYYHNLDISLWHDEAFSALLIKYPWGEMMSRIGLDVHPPAYYIFLRLWHYIFGDSLLSLRSFSVFFSAGTIWAGWLFAKEAFKSETAAVWAAALIAINPFQIQYATEARMYTMGAFFALLAAYFLVKALGYQTAMRQTETLHMPHLPESIEDRRRMIANYAGFAISIIITIYTHYYLLFAAAAICFYGLVYLFCHHRFAWKAYGLLFAAYCVIALSYLPWLKTFFFQYKQVGAGYWIPPMDRWSIPSTLYTLLVGFGYDVSQPNVRKLLILVVLLVLYALYGFLRKTQSFHKWLALLVSLAPFAGAALFSIAARLKGSGSSVYLVRYFIFTGAFLSIIVAVWMHQMKHRRLASVLLIVYCLVNLWAFVNYWKNQDIKNRPGMDGAARYLQANVEPAHKLYVGSSFMFFNLKYYVNEFGIPSTPLLYSGGNTDVKNLPHFAGTAILTNKDLLPDFNRDVKVGDTVWLVWTNGFGAEKPKVPNNWGEAGKPTKEYAYPEVRPYVGTNVYVSMYKIN